MEETTGPERGATRCAPTASRRGDDRRSPLREEVRATAQSASALRRRFEQWARVDVPPDVVADLALGMYEALANAVEHAYLDHPVPGVLRLEAHRHPDGVLIRVSDEGTWRTSDSGAHRGRGLDLMRHLAVEVEVHRGAGGTVVELRSGPLD